jgi:hypothetical protein
MSRNESKHRHFSLPDILVVALVAMGLLAIVRGSLGVDRNAGREASADSGSRLAMPLVQPYPPPITPSPTAVPVGGHYPIPQGVPTEVVSLATAPESVLLTSIQNELNLHDATALAARAAPVEESYCYEGACAECFHGSLIAGALSAFFSNGSQPLIEGYFRKYDPAMGDHAAFVFISGWVGQAPLPTQVPGSACMYLSTAPAIWRLSKVPTQPDTEWHWTSWEPRWRYEEAVRKYSISYGLGTYYVIRP